MENFIFCVVLLTRPPDLLERHEISVSNGKTIFIHYFLRIINKHSPTELLLCGNNKEHIWATKYQLLSSFILPAK